jgi:hypothetical protein
VQPAEEDALHQNATFGLRWPSEIAKHDRTWIGQVVEGIALWGLTAWRIGTKIRQDPCGLIVPSTTLQAFGGWNWTHLSQRLSPSG